MIKVISAGLSCAEADVTGASAMGGIRALLVELLVTGSEQTRIVIDRHELNRLFEGGLEDVAWEAFSSRLYVGELLEDAIEHLEAELEKAESVEGDGRKNFSICWFATPGADFDVVFQTLWLAQNCHLVVLAFGPWPHGSAVYVLDTAGRPFGFGSFDELLCIAPTMTLEEAIRTLSSGDACR